VWTFHTFPSFFCELFSAGSPVLVSAFVVGACGEEGAEARAEEREGARAGRLLHAGRARVFYAFCVFFVFY
jgi:hypothetical protein